MLHVAALFAGPGMIAALSAPPNIVESAAKGTLLAPAVILTIALLLLLVGLCALSTARGTRSMPFARPVLYITAAVLVLRAAALPVLLAIVPAVRAQLTLFEITAAILCLVLGGLFWLGLLRTRRQPGMVNA